MDGSSFKRIFFNNIEVASFNLFRSYLVICSRRLKWDVNHAIKKPYFSRFPTDYWCFGPKCTFLVRTVRRTGKTANNTHTILLFKLKVFIWFKNHVDFFLNLNFIVCLLSTLALT